jgi:hypothetical protein
VFDKRERRLLFEIERRAADRGSGVGQDLRGRPAFQAHDHHQATGVITAVAGLSLGIVLLIGPRPLTDAETAARRSTAPPRVAVADDRVLLRKITIWLDAGAAHRALPALPGDQ